MRIGEQNMLFRCGLFLVAFIVVLVFGLYGPDYNAGDFIYMKY